MSDGFVVAVLWFTVAGLVAWLGPVWTLRRALGYGQTERTDG